MTDLADKAINIQGKDYVLVKDRILAFNSEYKNGSIVTALVSDQGGRIVIKAKVTPDIDKPERYFTGYSQAVEGQGMVNRTAALENAETSSVGRALAMMGIGVLDSIASADEMTKAGAVTQSLTAEERDMKEATDAAEAHSSKPITESKSVTCEICGQPATEKKGTTKGGKQYHGVFCSTDDKSHTRWLWN